MKDNFEYNYSAPTQAERKEIDSIRRQYLTEEQKEESKFEKLKRLDRMVKRPAEISSLTLGVVGTLIFGLGLSCVLEFNRLFLGIILMAIGVLPIAIAYPIYKGVITQNKKKYGAEILQLSQELLNQPEQK